MTNHPVHNYESHDYRTSFWDKDGCEYEDRTEVIALKRLMSKSGELLFELGADAGRNSARYAGFDRIELSDFSQTQLEQAHRS